MNWRAHAVAASLIGLALIAPTHAQDKKYHTLKENIFLCISPQAYDEAMVRVRDAKGQALEALKKELGEAKQCMFLDHELAESIMAPYAIVLQRDGTKVQVQAIITLRERLGFLHRLINRYILVGWTDESNLEPKTIL